MNLQCMILLSASVLILKSVSCYLTTCRSVASVSERILQGHVINMITGKSLERCISDCEVTANCYSINYLSITKTCQLNSKTHKWYPRDFVRSSADAIYLESLVREYSPCADRVPPCSGICLAIPGSLETTCVCNHSNISLCQSNACTPGALGMHSRDLIKSSQIRTSSNSQQKDWGRLDWEVGKAWTPISDNARQWFEVGFEPDFKIFTKIATKGRGPDFWWWVTKFSVNYRTVPQPWMNYKQHGNIVVFKGNTNRNKVVTNTFSTPFRANAIRIIFLPHAWKGRIALSIELYGCNTN